MVTNLQIKEAKRALDKVINIARVHFYKPIQIAEILQRSRVVGDVDASDLENYRTASKRWRDEISLSLVGNRSTSSARYQDDLFNENAVPPAKLAALDALNRAEAGMVENYIYQRTCETWRRLPIIQRYLVETKPEDFSLREFLSQFEQYPGLKRSIDKAYEIVVYALFQTLTRCLKMEITLSVKQPDKAILSDFSRFLEIVVGMPKGSKQAVFSAELYRLGVAHAADTGLDILSNFGPAIQVKHVTLDRDLLEHAVQPLSMNKLVIVCLEPQRDTIEAVLDQTGFKDRIQGIVTDVDLGRWYELALGKYRDKLAKLLIRDLATEFAREFPHLQKIQHFLRTRGYRRQDLRGIWKLTGQRPEEQTL